MNVAVQLARVLDIPLPELAEKLRPKMRTNDFGELVPVKRVQLKKKLETEEWNKVRQAMDQVSFGVDEHKLRDTTRAHYNRIRRKGIFDEPEELRFYPNE